MVIKPKPCKYCESIYHQSFQCKLNPKNKNKKNYIPVSAAKREYKPLKRTAIKVKVDKLWEATKKLWFELNPPDHSGYYYCKLKPCFFPGVPMTKAETRLDHIKPKGSFPKLKYVLSNLRPAHDYCNGIKGSLSDEEYQKKAERMLAVENRTKNY